MHTHTRASERAHRPTRCALVVGGAAATPPLRETLAREGFTTIVECAGREMIPAVEQMGGVDLALVDSDIEGAAALDLVAYLRHRMPTIPIVLVVPAGAGLLAAEARERGANGFLGKPVEPAAVAAAVRAALRGEPVTTGGGGDEQALVQSGRARATPDGTHLWSVVLAGGEGRRLRPLVRHVHGDARPKQYARLAGRRSLLAQTLDRTSLLLPPERTVVVSVRSQRRHLAEVLAGRAEGLLLQPCDRGTAAGVVLPVRWVVRRDPEATVVIFPCDHFVQQERRFIAHVAAAAAFVDAHPTRIVLVGADPTGPETEYGWIQPGAPLSRIGTASISRVERFIEKPSLPVARACLGAGALWNTFVVVARATTLADAARQILPAVHDPLAAVVPLLGTPWGLAALRRAYAGLPSVSFSTAVLEHCAPLLAVCRLDGVTWCDWGSPRRVIRTLLQAGRRPHWLPDLGATRLA